MSFITIPQAKRVLRMAQQDPKKFGKKIRKRLRNTLALDHKFNRDGQADWPIILTFEVTHLCNLKCYMCDLYGTDVETDVMRSELYGQGDILNLGDMDRILKEVSAFDPTISITGGEPMLYKEVVPFLELVNRYQLASTMTSNGVLMGKKVKDIVKAGLDHLTLSIDGPAEVHDQIRGKPGALQSTLETLSLIQETKAELNITRPEIQFNVSISARNQDCFDEVLSLAEEVGVGKIVFSQLWYWPEDMITKHNQLFGDIAPMTVQNMQAMEGIDASTIWQTMERIKKRPTPVAIKWLPDLNQQDIIRYYNQPLEKVGSHQACLAPWMNTRILPNGDVIPCLDSCWGNLKTQSFAQCWNSPTAKTFRQKTMHGGTMPACMRCCGLYSY